MAVIVGDKLKLSNYSYLLNRDGKSFVGELQNPERRDREEKLIDAVDIDWRPFRFKNFSYVSTAGKATYTYVTEPGDLFDTERLIDWISYSYSMGKNLDFYGYVFHNNQPNLIPEFSRPTMLTNIGWVDKDSRIIGYTFWPAVGSISRITTLDKVGCQGVFTNITGEIFNDYKNNIASGNYAHAEGQETESSGIASHAEGIYTKSIGNGTHTEGSSSQAIGNYSHSEGDRSITYGEASHAEGCLTKTYMKNTHAEGHLTLAYGEGSHAEGYNSYAYGYFSHAEGVNSISYGNYSHSEGGDSYAYSNYSHTEGQFTSSYGEHSHAEGYRSITYGEASHAEGQSTQATGSSSHSEGISTISSGDYSHAEGSASQSTGLASHAEGQLTDSQGAASHAEGFQTTSGGDYSHAEGYETSSSGDYSHAEGKNSEANGLASHAEGSDNVVNANNSHIEGSNNTINEFSNNTHVEGVSNTANNSVISHIEGESNTVVNSNSTHVGGNNNNIAGTNSSLIYGSNNKTSSSTNITVLGEGNEITAKKSAIIGTLSKIQSGANYSQVLGTNSYTSKSYVTIVGNDTYSSGSYSLLLGNNLGSSSEHTIFIGEDISNGFGGSNPISIGRNITSGWEGTGAGPGYYNPISIGVDIKNHGRENAVAIGYGINISNNDGQKIVIGKYNVTPGTGYQFIIGDGTDDTHRHNAVVTTNNNWTYVTALATYINNITTTEQNVKITYNTNFVTIKSFNEIKRGIDGKEGLANNDSNTYNLNFNTYLLPTKRYVDKLLAAKDVFRFAGTFTPQITAWEPAQTSPTVKGTWNPSHSQVADSDNDIEYSYSYSNADFSAGAVWKSTTTGWFGSTYVMGGDIIISYSDAATGTNESGWAIIDTHIAFMENWGTYSTYIGNGALLDDSSKDLRNFFITNINLSDTGYLSYTYAGILAEYRTDSTNTDIITGLVTKTGNDNNKKFLSNISLIRHNDRIELAYTYTDFLICYTTPLTDQYTNIDTMKDEKLQFVYNVYLDSDGVLSYSKYTLKGFRHHHHITGAYNWSYAYLTYDTGDDLTYIVSNIHLTNDGHLTYAYTVLSNLRNHHRTRTYDFKEFNDDTRSNESLRVVTNVNLDSNGNLTYTGYTVTNLLNHHHQEHGSNAYNTHKTLEWDDTHHNDDGFGFIGDLHLTTDGRLTYITSSITGLRKHHDTITYTLSSYNIDNIVDYTGKTNPSGDSIRVIDNVNLDNKGTLTYSGYVLTHLKNHHHTLSDIHTTSTVGRKDNSNEQDYDVNTGTSDKDSHKVISYVWQNSEGKLQAYYYTINNLAFHHSNNKKGTTTLTTYSWQNTYTDVSNNLNSISNTITFVDDVNLTTNGKFTYHLTTISNLRHHHSYKDTTVKGQATGNTTTYNIGEYNATGSDGFGFISNVSMTTDGRLTYTTSSITNLKTHHGTTQPTSFKTTYHVIESKTVGTNEIGFISEVNLDADGEFTYQVSRIDGLRKHHTDSLEAPSTAFGGHNFVTDISLSEYGDLTGTFGTFGYSGSHDTTGDKNFSAGAEQKINVVTGIKIDGEGQISYSYSEVKNTRNHHTTGTATKGTDLNVISKAWSYTPISYTAGEKAHDNAYTDAITFLDGVNLNSAGTLTYHYTKINHLRSHHRGRFVANVDENNIDKLGQNGHFAFVDSISLSPEGELTATSKTVEIPKNVDHADSTGKFDHKISIQHGKYGTTTTVLNQWDGSKDVTVDLNNHGTKTAEQKTGTLNFDGEFKVITGVSLDSTGYLLPTITTYTLPTINHHSGSASGNFITSVSLSKDGKLSGTAGTFGANKGTELNGLNICTGSSKLAVITGATIDSNGKFSYSFGYIIDNLEHHSGSVTSLQSTATPGFSGTFNVINSVSLSKDGKLSGNYVTITMPPQGHHSTSAATGGSAFTINQNDTNSINVITDVNLSLTGTLSKSYRKLTDYRGHHSVSHNYSSNPGSNRTVQATHSDRDGTVTVLTYANLTNNGQLQNRYETIQLLNQKTLIGNDVSLNSKSDTTIIKSVSIKSSTDTNGDVNFYLQYGLDNVWESNVS